MAKPLCSMLQGRGRKLSASGKRKEAKSIREDKPVYGGKIKIRLRQGNMVVI